MRSLLVLQLFIGLVCSTCPPQYQLIEDTCVRLLFKETKMEWDEQIPISRLECKADGATLPIIHSSEDNDRFTRIVYSFDNMKGKNPFLVLDLECNHSNRRLQWIGGSAIDYTPPTGANPNFDCVAKDNTFIHRADHGDWMEIPCDTKVHFLTVLCVWEPVVTTTATPLTCPTATPQTCPPCPTMDTTSKSYTLKPTTPDPESEQCGDYMPLPNSSDETKPCVKLFTDRHSWNVAQRTCAGEMGSLATIHSDDENKYLWRTAMSNNLLDGVHIGAHQSTEDPNVWTWVDGEVPFTGKTYDNFIGSFPIPGGGECVSMMTESSSALWINEDCNNNKQPYFCRRRDVNGTPKNCPKDTPKAGEDIISPGYPYSDISCEYVLFVGANKLVEIEISVLVTDANNDTFEIFEGTSGSDLLANLAGTILTPIKLRTTSSNVVRVNWTPRGKGINRGFKFRYYQVDA